MPAENQSKPVTADEVDVSGLNTMQARPQIVANTLGALICSFYFLFLDPLEVESGIAKDLIIIVILIAGLLVLGTYLGRRWSRDIEDFSKSPSSAGEVDPVFLERIQRKVLNGPLVYSLIAMFNWGLAALFMGMYRWLVIGYNETTEVAFLEGLRVSFGVLVSGVATASIVFLYMESIFRKIRPFFFPHGGLVQVRGVFRLSVRHRLLYNFLLVGVGPMIVVGLLFYHKATTSLTTNPETAMANLIAVIILVPAVLICVASILSRLVAASIGEPIKDMERAMAKVRSGDLSASVAVRENDELGSLAESFNLMIDGLKERERMRQSLDLAMEVQQSLLPQKAPEAPGLDIAGYSVYCDETGGDYYDFIDLTDRASGTIAVVVGDVSDHGLQSALLMTTARAFLRQRAAMPGGPGWIVTDVNKQLTRDVEESGRFMTLFYCVIDTEDRSIRWVRAGHEPALVFDRNTHSFEELAGSGLPLGISLDYYYEEYHRDILPGQIIVLATDGIWEARNPQGELFGKDAFKNIVQTHADESAADIIRTVMRAVDDYINPRDKEDDITLVIVKIEDLPAQPLD